MNGDDIISEKVIRSSSGLPIALFQDNVLTLLSLCKSLEDSKVTQPEQFIHVTCMECTRVWQLNHRYVFTEARMIGSKTNTKFWTCMECGVEQELEKGCLETKDGTRIKWQYFYRKATPTTRQPLSLIHLCIKALKHVPSNKRMDSDLIEQIKPSLQKRLRIENKNE